MCVPVKGSQIPLLTLIFVISLVAQEKAAYESFLLSLLTRTVIYHYYKPITDLTHFLPN